MFIHCLQFQQVLSAAEHEQEVERLDFDCNNADNSDLEEVPAQELNTEENQSCFVCKKVVLI